MLDDDTKVVEDASIELEQSVFVHHVVVFVEVRHPVVDIEDRTHDHGEDGQTKPHLPLEWVNQDGFFTNLANLLVHQTVRVNVNCVGKVDSLSPTLKRILVKRFKSRNLAF